MSIISTKKFYDNVTIVVNSCDSYEDVLNIFFISFNYNWSNCPFKIIINTELNSYTFSNAKTFNYINYKNIDDWGDRLLKVISSIETDYIIMLYDDYILEKEIIMHDLDNALNFLIENNENAVVFLVATPLLIDETDFTKIFIKVNTKSDYKLNSAPAIWRRNILLSYIQPGDTPWTLEVFGSYRTFNDGNNFYTLNPAFPDIYSYDYTEGGAIYRGKWVRKVIDRISLKYNISLDWSKRGFSTGINYEKRSFIWKFRFLKAGFRMVGFKIFYYMYRYLKVKIKN